MTVEMVAPAWMHLQISVGQYDSWSAEQCADIEIVDGRAVVSPSAAKRHSRPARILANALGRSRTRSGDQVRLRCCIPALAAAPAERHPYTGDGDGC
ncbi:hypothetical protein GCM10010253_65560 [Streptomyces badius]|uniref:Restriction endonuclease domain-containing protein n=1 Tax=Streptomyces badius TaxID=1941 RepID=A0ABQ2TNR4_STRBA|nr:hypothetical protein GCM10010253_65560 [Streptomyces badius]